MIGLSLGAVYNANTPDLYVNNAHHKIGWIFTWFAMAWIILGITNRYATRFSRNGRHAVCTTSSADSSTQYHRLRYEQSTPEQRCSEDTTQHVEQGFNTHLVSESPSTESENKAYDHTHAMHSINNMRDETCPPNRDEFVNIIRAKKFLSNCIRCVALENMLSVSKIAYIIFERLFVVLAFIVLTTGIVTFGGIFVRYSTI
jgi:hypothetical protein